MAMTRRDALRLLAAGPSLMAGGCCLHGYPKATQRLVSLMPSEPAGLFPAVEPPRVTLIDVHAHFFNASDVPVRDFVADCVGHSAPVVVQPLIRSMAPLANLMARFAPSAKQELGELSALSSATRGLTAADRQARVQQFLDQARQEAANAVATVTRGSRFLRLYRQMTGGPRGVAPRPLTIDEVRAVVGPPPQPRRGFDQLSEAERQREAAEGALGFLHCMLSRRALNLATYREAYEGGATGVTTVLGAMVDFDHWLDCPPISAHEDQILVHELLASESGGVFRPLLGYNPWTDIKYGDAGLRRVQAAWEKSGSPFVGVKIYPPMGFYPARNAPHPVKTKKTRPRLEDLDDKLDTFFAWCASARVPVMSHTGRSNGRDNVHDEFGGPEGWCWRLEKATQQASWPVLNLGHIGGGPGTDWTARFATLMQDFPMAPVYGDLGYWEELMQGSPELQAAKHRLKDALSVSVGNGTVADRVMFGSDWLMLSMQRHWRMYAVDVVEALKEIAPSDWEKVTRLNATECFGRLK